MFLQAGQLYKHRAAGTSRCCSNSPRNCFRASGNMQAVAWVSHCDFGETMGLINAEQMPPSKERTDFGVDSHNVPLRSVTLAVNYEWSKIKALEQKRRSRALVPTSTSALLNVENDTPNIPSKALAPRNVSDTPLVSDGEQISTETNDHDLVETPSKDATRRSAREKRRDTPTNKTRVRYDMQLVPPARRSQEFLDCFPLWWIPTYREAMLGENAQPTNRRESLTPCERCSGPALPVFAEDTSVLWIPKSRSEWEDSVSEMTAVCTSAAIRRYYAQGANKPFHPPLSAEYIRDRIDIDDPLLGYQLRHKSGGWLQGFVLFTNFTVWTHNFHWDSKHEICGIDWSSPHCDSDGSLAKELEEEERIGDPHGEGIVFPTIAEISLVGGLACGEYMLRMAMEDIRAGNRYKFVVLQSTEQSKSFYERFGFVRVGAICQYGNPGQDGEEPPIMGYRHWTHANESEKSLELHGGPSYMMCLKLPEKPVEDSCSRCGLPISESNNPDLKKALLALQVEMKPTVEPLGASFTPGPRQRRSSSMGSINADTLSGYPSKRGRGRPKGKSGKQSLIRSPKTGKRKFEQKPSCSKRQKVISSPEYSFGGVLTPARNAGASSVSSVLGSSCGNTRLNGQRDRATCLDQNNRAFYSVRGPDGRFVTVSAILPRPEPSDSIRTKPKSKFTGEGCEIFLTKRPSVNSAASPNRREENEYKRSIGFGRPDGKPTPIDRLTLLKQKVRAYPRHRVHFYNRVVKPLSGPRQYYFVLHFEESIQKLRIAPLEARGRLSGKREGRPRYQVVVQDTDSNFLTVDAADYTVVPATMVMKTPVVANEAFDIEE